MKRTRVAIGLTVVLGLLVLLVAGCTGAGSVGLEGTWVSGTSTFVITATTLSATDTNFGTWNCTIDSTDSAAGHMVLTQTSATGLYALLSANGTKFYATYQLNGDTLLFDCSDTGYPAAATTTFTRQ